VGNGRLADEFLSTQVVERRLGPIGGRQLAEVEDCSEREDEAAGIATSRGPFSDACRFDKVAAEIVVVVVLRVSSGIVGICWL